MGHAHPRQPKRFKSQKGFRKFLAYIHMRSPRGKKARGKETISGRTPRSRKERVVYVEGKRREPELSS